MNKYAATLSFLFFLVLIDGLFMGFHALHVWSPWLKSGSFSIELDGGRAEQFQYIKQIWLCAALGLLWIVTRGRSFLVWALFFFFLLLDDALQLHETLGVKISAALDLGPAFGLRPDDFGELIFAGAVGGSLLLFVAYIMRVGSDQARQLSADLMCFVGALAVFGVLIDTLHTITYFRWPAIAPALALIEDGGEMIVVSCIAAYAFDALNHRGELRIPVWPKLRTRLGVMAPKVGEVRP